MDLSEKPVGSGLAIVRRQPTAIEKAEAGTKRILSCMVGDTLALAKKDDLAPVAAKFRIGECELCEPDYRQLIIWAEQLRLTPAETLRRLKQGLRAKGNETRVENGKFTALNWDAGLLHGSDFQMSIELELSKLSFAPVDVIADSCDGDLEDFDGISAWDELPKEYDRKAKVLRISSNALPRLKVLDCACIGLEYLVMGSAPELERLDCTQNCLSVMNLRSFPILKELICPSNLIKELDLHSVSKLRKLNCSDNDMRELILPNLPDLVELECSNSLWDKDAGGGRYLEKIDLRGAPNLEHLNCFDNMLESLNLRCVPKLKHLKCAWNPLMELNLTDVPLLETLKCYNIPIEYWSNRNPPFIGSLDISGLRCLKELDCDNRTQIIQRPDQHFNAVKK